jgi:hypothetical protein
VARDEVLDGEHLIYGVSSWAIGSGIVQRLERGLPARAPRVNKRNGWTGRLSVAGGGEALPEKEGGLRPGRVCGARDEGCRAGGCHHSIEGRITNR